jgi:hypothetical protein
MRVTILDTQTGEKKTTDETFDFDAYWWAEGNGSCDCNREIPFVGLEMSNPCRTERYLIVEAESDEYSLEEYNSDYPAGLKEKHLCVTG